MWVVNACLPPTHGNSERLRAKESGSRSGIKGFCFVVACFYFVLGKEQRQVNVRLEK